MDDVDHATTILAEMQNKLNNLGGKCNNYEAGIVGWNDRKHELNEASVSSLCITDSRVESPDGGFLPYLKPENLNEEHTVDANKIMFTKNDGTTVTAQDILNNTNEYIDYNGFKNIDTKINGNKKLVIRVQATFIPIKRGTNREILLSHYSHPKTDNNDLNVIITGMPSGIYGYCDANNVKRGVSFSVDGKTENTPVSLGFKEMGKTSNTFLVMSYQQQQNPNPKLKSFSCDDDYTYGSHLHKSCSEAAATSLILDSKIAGPIVDPIRISNALFVLTIHKYYSVEYDDTYDIEKNHLAMAVDDMEDIYDMCD